MRGLKAKRIRREVYGDFSPLAGSYQVAGDGSIRRDALRATYQYRKGRRLAPPKSIAVTYGQSVYDYAGGAQS